MPEKPVAIVTGAYRGLGYETCRQLAQRGYRVILTARREAAGSDAAAALQAEGLEVNFHRLDVTSETSLQQFAAYLRSNGICPEVLVNNAGIFPDPAPDSGQSAAADADLETIRTGFETNTLGPLRLCQLLLPLMNNRGRVVNVSSGMGQLSEMNGGCPGYRLSKTALNAITRILADEWRNSNVKINSVCPGWVKTAMGGAEAPLTCEEGAAGIVWAATLPADGPSGGFFRHGVAIDW